MEYTGQYTLDAVTWTLGDGTSETVSSNTISHVYSTSGTFEVKADVTVKKGSESSCTSSHKRSITID
ncbi:MULTISPECIES: PKD domain-containing protein [unclassified Flavobacterium]|uniref:PKD domain-containing protein n=1 Tax=Flavobacterium sp. KMS TaxID=1566023 RepID=UPI002100AEB0|nr:MULTISPECIES: PKD domain-containing protein [unclassified Flavobacterium]